MTTFHFELVSPEKLLFSGEVESVVVPGVDGQFTVLKDHAPVMSLLKAGIVEIFATVNRAPERLVVRGGFADVAASGLTLLADQAVPFEQFDTMQLAQDIKNAEEDLADARTDEAIKIASEKLDQLNELKLSLGA
ncbi:F0F1 ATP synthase subunit epsilon [Rhodoblastus sp.]|uniref:F0F1 ATP synthase subunit epsilon n=1 Tax=Rhodoblastus sp. TaxID=1962975 RepID=UPI003F95E431